ncbi:hypothetical protein JCM10213_003792 [Rhodosporidiobolus nylandii]
MPLPPLSRLVTSSSPVSLSNAAGGEASLPLLSRSHASSPSSRRNSASAPSSLPFTTTSSSPLSSPVDPPSSGLAASAPRRAARLSSARRWALLAAAVLVGVVLLVGTRSEAGEARLARVREGWSAAWDWGGEGLAGGWRAPWAAKEQGEGAGGAPGEGIEGEKAFLAVAEGTETGSPTQKEEAPSGSIAGAPSSAAFSSSIPSPPSPPASPSPTSPSPSSAASLENSKRLNVHPYPRPPPCDPGVAKEMRYLSFENHSGFHNQRKSLTNALVLASLLNRTLLLPPARLGSPIPWGPNADLALKTVHSERCKAGLEAGDPLASSTNSPRIGSTECDDPQKWTYVGWEFLVDERLFEGRSLVDRWNSSEEWFFASPAEGGLGLTPEDVKAFDDPDRRSYQIYDLPSTPSNPPDLFSSRIDLPSLASDPARLLRFGSLFSGARIQFAPGEEGDWGRRLLAEANEGVILRSEGLDRISDRVRDLMGSYVAAHARVGDGVFKSQARPNMLRVFRRLAHDVLGLRQKLVDELLAEYRAPSEGRERRRRRGFRRSREVGRASAVEEGQEEEEDLDLDFSPASHPRFRLARRSLLASSPPHHHHHLPHQKRGPSAPLSPLLHCRRPLHTRATPDLLPLNTPLYIATDARAPATDPALEPFFRWFPCVFVLDDFLSSGSGGEEGEGEGEEGVGTEVPELRELVEARDGERGRWTSEWDGQGLAKYLYPFLEAEISARAVEVVGTPQSTFSGYTAGILHESYVAQGMVAPWEDEEVVVEAAGRL